MLAFRTSRLSCKRRLLQQTRSRREIKAGVYYYLSKPYSGVTLLGIVNAALADAKTKKKLREKVYACGRALGLMEEARFRFQTLKEAAGLASFVSICFPEPENVVIGLHELLLNAVEHGNLGITYSEKTKLLRNGSWREEIERKLSLPEWSKKFATLTFKATQKALTVHIKDAGRGFDWKNYLDFSIERVTDPHGRGIATSRKLSFHSLEYLGVGNEVRCAVMLDPAAASQSKAGSSCVRRRKGRRKLRRPERQSGSNADLLARSLGCYSPPPI